MTKKNNKIIQGKIKKKRKSLGSGYAGNILKSLGYSARDVISEVMPNASSTISSAVDTKRELNEALSIAAKKSNEMIKTGKSKLTDFRDNDLKAAIEDLKSGKIYNKDRLTDPFENFGGMDGFGDFGDFGDEDFDSGEFSSNDVTLDFDIPEDSPMVEAQEVTTATVSRSAEYISKENKANSITVATSVSKMSVNLASGLQLVHSEIAKLSTVIPKSLTEHAALSAKYYEDSIGYQKRIAESLDELKQLYLDSKKTAGSTKDSRESALDKYLGLDLGGYVDLVKSQTKSTIVNNPTISMFSMIANMLKMSGDMMNDGKGVAAKGLNQILKFALGKGIKRGAGKVDEFLEDIFLPISMKLGKWQDAWDDPFKQFIGNILGIKARPDMTVDKSKYEKGAVAFDGKVHRAITDVIPTYLRMITSALTGKEEIAFDYEKGVYNTVANIQKDFDKSIKDAVNNEYFSERFDFGRIVDKLEDVSKEQGDQIKKVFDDFLFNMAKSEDLITFRGSESSNDISKLTGRSVNDPVVKIITEYFEGLYNQGRHSELNEIFGRKSLGAKRNLENVMQKLTNDPTSSNYHLIDNGLYSSKQGTVSSSIDPIDEQLDNIIKRYGEHDPRAKEAVKQREARKRSGEYHRPRVSNSNKIKLANTGAGLGLDKYERTTTSYLRDILATLATGIKVVNVGIAEGNTKKIINHSKKMLKSLKMDEDTFRISSLSNDTQQSEDLSSVTYNPGKTLEAITSVLDDTRTEDGILEWASNKLGDKFGDDNAVKKVIDALRSKRDNINEKANDIATRITGTGIDVIYGRRENSTEQSSSNDSPFDSSPDDIVPPSTENPTPSNNSRSNDSREPDATVSRNVVSDIRNSIVGERNGESGEYRNGVLSSEANMAAAATANMTRWSHDLIYGTEDGRQAGLIPTVQSFFGMSEDGKLNIKGKLGDAKQTLTDHIAKRAYEWSELIFGKEDEGEDKKLDIFLGDMKGKKGKIAGSAAVGVLGSFFLPGGPITGALIGAGTRIVKESTQLQNVLFGEVDDETGERSGAIISKEVQGFFKNNGKSLKIGAGVGLLGSFFLPGGPITGALIGSGLSLALKSEQFGKLLYGDGGTKEDPTGGITKFIKDHYNKNKDTKATFLDAGLGAGVGLLGSFFLPGGPITGALIGAAANIGINSDKFKDWFFGEEDPDDNGKRQGGVFGKVRDELSLWMTENVTSPLKASMENIKGKAKKFLFGDDEDSEEKGLVGAIAKQVDKSAFGDLKRAVKENIIDKMKDGFKKLFGGIGKLIGSIIKAPVKAVQAIAESGDDDSALTVSERIEELNEKAKTKIADAKAKLEEKRSRKEYEKFWKTALDSKEKEESTTQSNNNKSNPNKPGKSEDRMAENTEKTAEATSNVETIVQKQLDSTNENHKETVGIMHKILESLPFKRKTKKGGANEEEPSAKVTTGTRLTGPEPVERIDRNVEKIAKAVDGQLDGVGYNINRIYKLLRKRLKKGDDDEDDDGDDVGSGNKKRGFFRRAWGKIKSFHPVEFAKNGVKKIGSYLKGKITGVFKSVIDLGKKFVGGVKSVVGAVLKLPGMVFNAAKAILPKMGEALWGTLKVAGGFLSSAIKGLGTVIETGAKGFGLLISGAMQGFGALMHGVGIFGKEALTLLGKGVTGAAKLGVSAVKWVTGGLIKKLGNRDGKEKTELIIKGGHLDYVSVIKRIGGKVERSDEETTTSSNIIPFPGNGEADAEADGSSRFAAFQGGANRLIDGIKVKYRGAKSIVKGKMDAIAARAKGSYESIKERFKKEDGEKDKKNFMSKVLSLLTRNTESGEKHHSVWSSIFSKKGLITAGLILMAPFLLKVAKGIINFLNSGIGEAIKDTLASVLKWLKNAFDDEGGIPGMINNVKENVDQIAEGLGQKDSKHYVIDKQTGAIKTDENGNLETYEKDAKFSLKELFFKKKVHIDPETGQVSEEATYDNTTEMLGKAYKYGAHKGVKLVNGAVSFGKKVKDIGETAYIKGLYAKDHIQNGMKAVSNSKLGKTIAAKGSQAFQKVANTNAGKVVMNVAEKGGDLLSLAKKYLKKGIEFVTEKFVALGKKFGLSGNGLSKISKNIANCTKGLWDDTLIKKFSPTIQKILAKMGISTGSALIAEIAFVTWGALSGATNPGELFEVNMDDIQNAKTKAVMIAISTVYKGIMGSSFGSWFDLACSMIYEVSGFNLAKVIATFILNLLSGEETEQDLAQAQDKFDQRYDEAINQQYEAWKKNQEQSGQATMTLEEFKASDLAMSRSDFNLETNKTLGKRIFDGTKSVVKGIGGAAKNLGSAVVSTFKSHDDVGWFDANGSYYVKNGAVYDHYNANGDMIDVVDPDTVDTMIETGQLTKSSVRVDSGIKQDINETLTMVKSGWKAATSTAKNIWSSFKDKASSVGKKVIGIASTVAKFKLPHRETVFATSNGSYYRQGSNGTYDYYSPLGFMISTGIPEDEINPLIESGQLTETKKWVTSGKTQKFQQIGSIAFNTFRDLTDLASKTLIDVGKRIIGGISYWGNSIKENGVLGAVVKAFTPKVKGKGWYDVNGNYYVLNDDGETYNYYNSNGDLIAENVEKDEVDAMKMNGMLTEADVVEDSDAQAAIKSIREKVSEVWNKAKEIKTGALNKLKNWLGIETTDISSGASVSAGLSVMAGKGDKESEPTSTSGTMNGFAYYSQNDPRFKDQDYKLSNGTNGTMGERGCGPAAMSMVASQLTGKNIDPVTMANMSTQGGFSVNEGTSPEYFQNVASSMGISSSNVALTKDAIKKSLASGTPMIFQGMGSDPNSPFTSEGHYVVGVGLNGDNIIVNDPRGRDYSKQYSLDSIMPNMQNAWAFSNDSLQNNNSYNASIFGMGPSASTVGSSLAGSLFGVSNTSTSLSQIGSTAKDSITAMKDSGKITAKKLRDQVVNAIMSREGQNQYTQGSQRTQVGSGYGDCSATAQWALKTGANIDPGGYSGAQYTSNMGIDVDNTSGGPDESKLLPGDLLFYKRSGSRYTDGVGHVEMYIGNGKRMGHGSGIGPKQTPLSRDGGSYLKARRFITDNTQDFDSPNLPGAIASAGTSVYSDTNLSGNLLTGSSSEESSKENKSVLELLLGAASAFSKPIIEWMTGHSSGGESTEDGMSANSMIGNVASSGVSLLGSNSNIAPASNISGSSVAERMWGYYTGRGYSKPAVAAILGNGEGESGLNPSAVQGRGKGPAAGIFQWENYNSKSGRWKEMADHAASKGRDWTDLDSQMEYAEYELPRLGNTFWGHQSNMAKAGTTPTTYEQWKNSTDVDTATRQFEGAFERAGKPHMENRIAAAKKYYELYKDYDPNKNNEALQDSGKIAYAGVSGLNTNPSALTGKFKQPTSLAGAAFNTAAKLNTNAKGGKGGYTPVTNIQDSNRTTRLEANASNYTDSKSKLDEATNPIFRKMVELLGYIVENTSGINQGVKDLFDKEVPSETQIIEGGTHNNIIPVSQKDEGQPKIANSYNTAKRISAGKYLK